MQNPPSTNDTASECVSCEFCGKTFNDKRAKNIHISRTRDAAHTRPREDSIAPNARDTPGASFQNASDVPPPPPAFPDSALSMDRQSAIPDLQNPRQSPLLSDASTQSPSAIAAESQESAEEGTAPATATIPTESLPPGIHPSPNVLPPVSLGTAVDDKLKNKALDDNIFLPFLTEEGWATFFLEHFQLGLSQSESHDLHSFMDLYRKTTTTTSESISRKKFLEKSPFVLPSRTSIIRDNHGRSYIFKFRAIMTVLRELLGRSHLAAHYHVRPIVHVVERTGPDGRPRRVRKYSSIATGKRWEQLAASLANGRASLPFILSSDKTVVFANRAAWPLYIHLAGYDKDVHGRPLIHASAVIGYLIQLSTVHTDLKQLPSDRASGISKLVFHKALAVLFDDEYKKAAQHGVIMRFPTGQCYLTHPQLLAYLGDLPELALVTLVKQNRACPMCPAMASEFDKRVKNSKPRDPQFVKSRFAAKQTGSFTAKEVDQWEVKHGIHLLQNALWNVDGFNVHGHVLHDELHQIFIGLLGRHLCGALLSYLSTQGAIQQEFYARLSATPNFSSSPLRALKYGSLEHLTGAEWRSLATVLPAILIDLFGGDDPDVVVLQAIVPKVFTSLARLANLIRFTGIDEVDLVTIDETLDSLFSELPQYFEVLKHPYPKALVIHMLNHLVSSIRDCGPPSEYSTETCCELLHKTAAKQAAQFTSTHSPLEFGLFDAIQVHDALVAHFTFLAMYHPHVIARRKWGPSLQPLLQLVDECRSLNIPGVPRHAPLARPSTSVLLADNTMTDNAPSVADDSEDALDDFAEDPAAARLSALWNGDSAHSESPPSDAATASTNLARTITLRSRPMPSQQYLFPIELPPAGSSLDHASASSSSLNPAATMPTLASTASELASSREPATPLIPVPTHASIATLERTWMLSCPIRKYRHLIQSGGVSPEKLAADYPDSLSKLAQHLSEYAKTALTGPGQLPPSITIVVPHQRLLVAHCSNGKVVKEVIQGRCVAYHKVLRRDFAICLREGGVYSIIRPRLFISFQVHDKPHHVALVDYFAHIPERQNATNSLHVPVLRKTSHPIVIPIQSIICAAHLIPYFATLRDPPIATAPEAPKSQQAAPTVEAGAAAGTQGMDGTGNGETNVDSGQVRDADSGQIEDADGDDVNDDGGSGQVEDGAGIVDPGPVVDGSGAAQANAGRIASAAQQIGDSRRKRKRVGDQGGGTHAKRRKARRVMSGVLYDPKDIAGCIEWILNFFVTPVVYAFQGASGFSENLA